MKKITDDIETLKKTLLFMMTILAEFLWMTIILLGCSDEKNTALITHELLVRLVRETGKSVMRHSLSFTCRYHYKTFL